MSFQVGDKVRFLNAVGYGVVTKIIDKKKFQIENEFGFEEIYNINELVVEGSKEDYNKDNLLSNKEIENKLKIDKHAQSAYALQKKLNRLHQKVDRGRLVIDLHIENLISSHSGMSNFQILNIQISHFKSFLNSSIAKKANKIVVIHGVGEGVLRHEIRKELDVYHPSFEFYDASYEEFGYGATEIILKY